VIVEVTATAVNRADLLQRQGKYPPPAGASEILGLECSGTIQSVGPALTLDRIGERVTALLAGGGYATKVAVPVGQLMGVPDGIDIVTAAGLPEVACTAWSNLRLAHLRAGETVLIHGGGSGVGTMAIQIARELGARVAVTAGSQAKLDRCAGLGAEILINYYDVDFVEAIKDATGGKGPDVLLDNMGASYLKRNIEALAHNGRIVIIGMQGGATAEIDIAPLLRRCGTIHATSMRARSESEKAAICREVEKHVWPWIESGAIVPVIGAVLPLEQAAEAHRMLADGEVVGKIVLKAP
jgi:putative PIG3 family NAD(P)H quinone oxidoreductase